MGRTRTDGIVNLFRTGLDLCWWGLLVGIPVFAVLATLTYLVPSSPVAFLLSVDVQLDPAGDGRILTAAGERAADVRTAVGQLAFRRLPPVDALVAVLLWTLYWSLALPVVFQLRKVFIALQDGSPFGRDTVTALRRLGVAVIVAYLVRALVNVAGALYVMRFFADEGASPYPLTINFSGIFVGLVLFVAAEVLRLGADMADEQALTV